MLRYLWVATALALCACAPPGYVYDNGDLLHPHPSADLCASRGLVLDAGAEECVVAAPPLPPVKPRLTASRSPAVQRAAQADVGTKTDAGQSSEADSKTAAESNAKSEPRPFPRVAAVDVPIETDAVIADDLRKNRKFLNELVRFAREGQHRCETISSVEANVASRLFTLKCDRADHVYEIEAKGTHWIVTVRQ
jgi:hypothetical protein